MYLRSNENGQNNESLHVNIIFSFQIRTILFSGSADYTKLPCKRYLCCDKKLNYYSVNAAVYCCTWSPITNEAIKLYKLILCTPI